MIDTADVIIIGSGIVGSSAAYYLAKQGKKVTVLEKYPNVGDGASSRNGAGVRLGCRKAPESWLAAKAVNDIWPTLGEELDADLEYVHPGCLTMGHGEKDRRILEGDRELDRLAGVDSELITGAQCRSICPYISDYVEFGMWTPADGYANPMLTTLAFYRAARRLGVKYITGGNVLSVEKHQGRARRVVTESGGVYEADKIVLAAGYNSRRIAKTVGLWLPMLQRPDELLVTEIQPALPPLRFSNADGTLYGCQTKHGSYIFGGNTNLERYEYCYDDRPINTDKQTGHKSRLIGQYFPMLAGVNIVRHWAGWIDSMVDRLPVIQENREVPGLVIACGFSGHGFAIGPAAGLVVSEIVLDRPTCVDVSALDYERFKPSHNAESI